LFILFGSNHRVKNDADNAASKIDFYTSGSHHQLLLQAEVISIDCHFVTDFITMSFLTTLSKRLPLVIEVCCSIFFLIILI